MKLSTEPNTTGALAFLLLSDADQWHICCSFAYECGKLGADFGMIPSDNPYLSCTAEALDLQCLLAWEAGCLDALVSVTTH